MAIRVVLVDDQTLVRQGIRSLLELAPDVSVVGEGEDGDAGIAAIRRDRPDVVLLDVRMPRKSGIEVLRELQASGELPPTILLTTFDDDELLLESVRAGARGYLLKDVSLEVLTDAIRAVAAGDTLIRPAVTERVLRGLEHVRRDFDTLSPPDPLTRREVEILRLMAGGYSNREIAEALGTAEGTVKNHASSILSKLGVRDRTRAVLTALERGYI
jgi:DNA-binding NarL/FixJ family response regulator